MYREERKERSRENVGENDGKNSPSLLKESCAAFFFLAKPLSVLGTRIMLTEGLEQSPSHPFLKEPIGNWNNLFL